MALVAKQRRKWAQAIRKLAREVDADVAPNDNASKESVKRMVDGINDCELTDEQEQQLAQAWPPYKASFPNWLPPEDEAQAAEEDQQPQEQANPKQLFFHAAQLTYQTCCPLRSQESGFPKISFDIVFFFCCIR